MAATNDGGTTFTTTPVALTGTSARLGQVSCGDTARCMVVTTAASVGITTDGGTSYSTAGLPVGDQSITVYCAPAGFCLVGGETETLAGVVQRSSDSGKAWSQVWESS
jgi:hypothetical protein